MDMADIRKYPCEIIPLDEDDGGGYMARFPDFPGVMSDGETPEEALANGLDALECAIEAMDDWGRKIPEPDHASGKMPLRMPKSLHAKLKLRAQADGVSENMTAVTLIAEGLGLRESTVQAGGRVTKRNRSITGRHDKDGKLVPRGKRASRSTKQKTG